MCWRAEFNWIKYITVSPYLIGWSGLSVLGLREAVQTKCEGNLGKVGNKIIAGVSAMSEGGMRSAPPFLGSKNPNLDSFGPCERQGISTEKNERIIATHLDTPAAPKDDAGRQRIENGRSVTGGDSGAVWGPRGIEFWVVMDVVGLTLGGSRYDWVTVQRRSSETGERAKVYNVNYSRIWGSAEDWGDQQEGTRLQRSCSTSFDLFYSGSHQLFLPTVHWVLWLRIYSQEGDFPLTIPDIVVERLYFFTEIRAQDALFNTEVKPSFILGESTSPQESTRPAETNYSRGLAIQQDFKALTLKPTLRRRGSEEDGAAAKHAQSDAAASGTWVCRVQRDLQSLVAANNFLAGNREAVADVPYNSGSNRGGNGLGKIFLGGGGVPSVRRERFLENSLR
ncbi:hypothetical protein DFH09DRAFT_1101660 [Mycena vulgaris]|nr:hypothetical protein DFH09DRAFT_1101660 [Mycena vulgaris]